MSARACAASCFDRHICILVREYEPRCLRRSAVVSTSLLGAEMSTVDIFGSETLVIPQTELISSTGFWR